MSTNRNNKKSPKRYMTTHPTPKFQFVIARYNEDLHWLNQIPPEHDIIVYNKGSTLDISIFQRTVYVIDINNVGREGHTFYYHIVNYYGHFNADFVAFLQGNPFDHCPNLFSRIRSAIRSPLPFDCLSNKKLLCSTTHGCPHHKHLDQHLYRTFQYIWGNPVPNHRPVEFGPGGQFYVASNIIQSYPSSYYQKIVDLLKYDVNPIEGFCIERYHRLIFSLGPNFNSRTHST